MFLDQVIHFGKNLGNQVKGHSPKKIESLIEVSYVAHLKKPVLSLNMNLFYSLKRDPSPSSPFRENLGDQVKSRSKKIR